MMYTHPPIPTHHYCKVNADVSLHINNLTTPIKCVYLKLFPPVLQKHCWQLKMMSIVHYVKINVLMPLKSNQIHKNKHWNLILDLSLSFYLSFSPLPPPPPPTHTHLGGGGGGSGIVLWGEKEWKETVKILGLCSTSSTIHEKPQ